MKSVAVGKYAIHAQGNPIFDDWQIDSAIDHEQAVFGNIIIHPTFDSTGRRTADKI